MLSFTWSDSLSLGSLAVQSISNLFLPSTPSVIQTRELCFPGEPCFPSNEILEAFNKTVDGLLFAERPTEASCYSGDLTYDRSECKALLENRHSDLWLTNHFGSYQMTNWQSCGGVQDSCYVPNAANATAACNQGSVPYYSVNARTVQHVQEYLKFATKHNLRIVVKNTGHDFHGRSSGQGGFALWTHEMKLTSRNASFVPKGCTTPTQDSVSLGAGVQWVEAYRFAHEQNVTLIGGAKPLVGTSGGWLLGGGHSFLSPSYGLGVDNLLEADIVTPDGELQTISECNNPDLFWAIRGGGGNTFGILTSVTYRAHASTSINVVDATPHPGVTIGPAELEEILNALAHSAHAIGDLGLGGALFVAETGTVFRGVVPGDRLNETQEALRGFFARTSHLLQPKYSTYPTYFDFYDASEGDDVPDMGNPQTLASRLISRKSLDPGVDSTALIHSIRQGYEITLRDGVRQTFYIIFGPPTKPGLKESGKVVAEKTSLHPSWYDSLWLVLFQASWDTTHPQSVGEAVFKNLHESLEPVRKYTPGMASYFNEADVYETDGSLSFWGEKNHARLLKIKKTVDPDNHLQIWQGVGAEDDTSKAFRCYAPTNPIKKH